MIVTKNKQWEYLNNKIEQWKTLQSLEKRPFSSAFPGVGGVLSWYAKKLRKQNPKCKFQNPKLGNEGVPNVYTRRNLGWGVGFPPGPLNFSQVPIFRSCDVKLEAVFQLEDSDCKNTFEKYKTRAKHIETHRTRHAIAPYIVGDVFRVAADRHQPVYNPAMPAANWIARQADDLALRVKNYLGRGRLGANRFSWKRSFAMLDMYFLWEQPTYPTTTTTSTTTTLVLCPVASPGFPKRNNKT